MKPIYRRKKQRTASSPRPSMIRRRSALGGIADELSEFFTVVLSNNFD
jgi:hypothetical protein